MPRRAGRRSRKSSLSQPSSGGLKPRFLRENAPSSHELRREAREEQLRRLREALVRRQREHRLDEAMIEQRRAQLEPVRHRREVGLAQHVLGQIVREVPAHQPVDARVAASKSGARQ